MVEVKNVSKKYSNGVVAVKNANLTLELNRFYAIKGHSGSGKTTLLQILGLLDKCTSGEVCIDGLETSHMSEKQKADTRMNKVGFVFQSYHLNEKLKAYENVMLPMYINPEIKGDLKERSIMLLEKLGLKDRINHYPKQLSGGEQQRVAIARALANDPDYIFADEPTGNLDSENEVIVFDILKSLTKENKCVLVVSHNDIITDYADTIFTMNNGILVSGGTNED